MLTVRPERPLPDILLELVRTLDDVAGNLATPYFIIGATARDILLEHVHGLEGARATRDVDFAVAVSSWDAFALLKSQLVATGKFSAHADEHRLLFDRASGTYPLDLVPFDGVENNGEIAWPPKGDFVMNVAGYADAQECALLVELAPGLQSRVIALSSLVVLKILAWNDRPDRSKHASDVLFVLRHYHQAGQFDRLYAEGAALLEQYDYDLELAGAAMHSATSTCKP